MCNRTNVSANLKALRAATGKSQEQVADDIEARGVRITRSTLGAYEENRNEPNLSMAKVLADYYQVSLEELIFKTT